jgi:hypothetical protein
MSETLQDGRAADSAAPSGHHDAILGDDPSFGVNPSIAYTLKTALWRELSGLKELLMARIQSIEHAIKIAHDDLVRVPTETQKQVGALKEFQTTVIENLRLYFTMRMEAVDKAIVEINQSSGAFPTRIDEKLQAVRDVHDERFRAVEASMRGFNENALHTHDKIETALLVSAGDRTDINLKVTALGSELKAFKEAAAQASIEQKSAVAAALQAAKEAVAEQNKSAAQAITKSELASAKQIDGLGELLRTSRDADAAKINDVKDRLTRIEGRGEGTEKTVTSSQAAGNYNVGIIGVVIGVVGILMAIATFLGLRGGIR